MNTEQLRPLTPADFEVLAFERISFKRAGDKDTAILERFQHSVPRYYQRLNWLLDHPAALAYDPELVHRLRRIRDGRRANRAGRRTGFQVVGA